MRTTLACNTDMVRVLREYSQVTVPILQPEQISQTLTSAVVSRHRSTDVVDPRTEQIAKGNMVHLLWGCYKP